MSETEANSGGAAGAPEAAAALEISDLSITYRTGGADKPAVQGVSLRVAPGESYGLVGESGSGKSTVALAVTRYLPRNGRVAAGSIAVAGQDVLALRGARLRELRARSVSMVYQEPSRALNPSLRVGAQVAEVFALTGMDKQAASEATAEMLRTVRIADPAAVMRRYPHELSGGMAQRVVIAMALAASPELLILDEPTTALDATVEAEVLDLIAALRTEYGTSVLFISHNLAVIAKVCDRVGVLYAGSMVEEGAAGIVFRKPAHPYTVGLLRSVPRRGQRKDHGPLPVIPGFLPRPDEVGAGCVFASRCPLVVEQCRTSAPPPFVVEPGRVSRCYRWAEAENEVETEATGPEPVSVPVSSAAAGEGGDAAPPPVIEMRQVSKTFRGGVQALSDVSLDVIAGQTLGIVGESGSGKTTLARVLLGLIPPDPGSVVSLGGMALAPSARRRPLEQLKALQIVFQNADSALNRRHSVRRLISQPLARLAGLSGAALRARLSELVAQVRLEERHLPLRPAQLSGGLKQRVAIARAFGGGPRVVVCDEPTSALDVSVQAAILNLLADLQRRERVTYLFISHDLGVVRYLSDQIVVLYLGRVMQAGPAEAVFDGPHHPYTEALLSAVPQLDGVVADRIRLVGEIPSAASPPDGCVFHTRCPRRLSSGVCETTAPPVLDAGDGHSIRCHIPPAELRRLQGVTL
ncbi:MAG TPA: ABC transporter ATP-binding protein [Trebonia sp.]